VPLFSADCLLRANAAGRNYSFVWQKVVPAAHTAGRWYDLSGYVGSPQALTYSGPALTATALVDGVGNVVNDILDGGNVAGYVKYLTGMEAVTQTATGAPSWLLLVDLLMYYSNINMSTGTQQVLTNVAPLPRYADGKGVQMFLVVTTATGATGHSLHSTGFTYTNTTPTPGRTIPGTVACTASAIVAHICHSGTAVNNFGPFIPLAAGDQGVKSVENFQLTSTSAAGLATLVLCKPLAWINLNAAFIPQGRDYLFHVPPLPQIYDGACLSFLMFSGAATAASVSLNAKLDFVWG